VDLAAALWGGIVGAIVMATVYAGFLGLRLTRLDLIGFEGGLVTRERGVRYVYGAVLQVVLGALLALAYRLAFEQIHSATYVGWGALAGLATGVLFVLLLPVLGLANQQVRSGEAPRPGLAGLAYGRWTPVALLVAFAVFGVWVGAFLLP
jgi:hypothetical protein